MAATNQSDVLDPDDLPPVERALLEYLREGRVTPHYCRDRLYAERDERPDIKDEKYSRGYIQQLLARFVEHDHARNLLGTGLYELTDDPSETADD